MSVEFYYVTVPLPLGPEQVAWRQTLDTWKENLGQLLDSVEDASVINIYEERYGDGPYIDDLEEDIARGQENHFLAAKARDEFKGTIEAVIEDEYEVNYFYVNGGYVIVTGGSSWGDSPTEIYDDVCVLANIVYACNQDLKEQLGWFMS